MKLAKPQETKSTIRFSAKLFRPKTTEKIGSWTLLTLPKNASAKLPSRGMTMVEGTINGFPFRAALEPNGKGSHWLRVNRAMHDAAGADIVGGYHTNRAPGLDSLDKLSQATGNTQAPDRESLRHACVWKATSMLFRRYKVADKKSRNIRRNMASVAELQKSFFAETDKVENQEDLEKLRVKYLGREKGIVTAVLRSLGGMRRGNRATLFFGSGASLDLIGEPNT